MTSGGSGDLDDLLEKKGIRLLNMWMFCIVRWKTGTGDLWTDLGQDYEIITMSRMVEEWLDGVNQLIVFPSVLWKRCRKRFSAGSVCRWSV